MPYLLRSGPSWGLTHLCSTSLPLPTAPSSLPAAREREATQQEEPTPYLLAGTWALGGKELVPRAAQSDLGPSALSSCSQGKTSSFSHTGLRLHLVAEWSGGDLRLKLITILFLCSRLLPSLTQESSQEIDCNDQDVFKAVDAALTKYNSENKSGKLSL